MPRTLARAATAAMFAACSLFLVATHAAAPPVKAQAPGYYRMMLGDFEITALSDGTVALQVTKLLTNTTPTRVDQALDAPRSRTRSRRRSTRYLVNTGASWS